MSGYWKIVMLPFLFSVTGDDCLGIGAGLLVYGVQE